MSHGGLARVFVKYCFARPAAIIVPIGIAFILAVSLLVGRFLWSLLGVDWKGRPLLAIPLILSGLFFVAWSIASIGGPVKLVISTFDTIRWFFLSRFMGIRLKPKPVLPLVVTGPYSLVRHPIYSGVLQLMLALGLIYGYPLLAALMLLAWFEVITRIEETHLYWLYGEEYLRYKRSTPKYVPNPSAIRRLLARRGREAREEGQADLSEGLRLHLTRIVYALSSSSV